MAAEIKFEFDEVTVKSVEKKLGRMKSEAPKALKNALNATAKDARKDLAHKAQETYAVKIGGFNKQMKIKPATAGNLVAVIETRGEHLEFKYFSVQGGHGPHGSPLTVLINKHHGRKTFGSGSGAFKNNVAASGQTRKKATAKGAAGSAVRHVAAAKRVGRSRLKIEKLFSVSVPDMIGNKAEVYGVVEPNIMDNLRSNVDKQVARILGG